MKTTSKATKGRAPRKPPVPTAVGWRHVMFFPEDGADIVICRVGKPLLISKAELVRRMNDAATDLFVWHGLWSADPASKQAEWTRAVERETGSLMRLLEMERCFMPVHDGISISARRALTEYGMPNDDIRAFTLKQYQFGEDVHDWLDMISLALFTLANIAEHASESWERNTRHPGERRNAGRGPLRQFLRHLGPLYRDAFGKAPTPQPSAANPFIRFVDAVRSGIIAYMDAADPRDRFVTDDGREDEVLAQLRQFTPQSAASLWRQHGEQLLKEGPYRGGQVSDSGNRPKSTR